MVKTILFILISLAIVLSACTPVSVQLPVKDDPPIEVEPIIQNPASSDLSPTGFHWPTGKIPVVTQQWLASKCDQSVKQYHTGLDIDAAQDDPVFAVADGYVTYISPNKWGDTDGKSNVGVLIEHHLQDGSSFIAIYGHLQTGLKKGDYVQLGQQIGAIGYWAGGLHLHLTISPGKSAKDPYGIMSCPESGKPLDTNGTVDPLIWLTTQYPGPYPQGEVLGASDTEPKSPPQPEGPTLRTVLVEGMSPFYLTFDIAKWDAIPLGDSGQFYLKHRTYTACEVRGLEPKGVADEWIRSDSSRIIAGASYEVCTFSTQKGSPAMIIYYVPPWKSLGIVLSCYDTLRFEEGSEIEVGNNPTMCLQDTEEVFALSAARSFGAE